MQNLDAPSLQPQLYTLTGLTPLLHIQQVAEGLHRFLHIQLWKALTTMIRCCLHCRVEIWHNLAYLKPQVVRCEKPSCLSFMLMYKIPLACSIKELFQNNRKCFIPYLLYPIARSWEKCTGGYTSTDSCEESARFD